MGTDPNGGRPSVLFLSQALPYPPDSGGKQRTYHVLRQLEQGYRVFLLPFHRRQHQATAEMAESAREALEEHVTWVHPPVSFPSEWSWGARAWNHLRSVATGRAYSYYQYAPRAFGEAYRRAFTLADPDLVHFDSIDFHRWLRPGRLVAQTCTHHDIESALLRRRATTAGNPIASRYVAFQAGRMRRVEEEYAPRFDLNLTMSPVDTERLRAIAPSAEVMEVPNAVSLDDFPLPEEDRADPDTVIFVGPTYLFANQDAVDYLLADIWPRVREARPQSRLVLVGRNRPGERERFLRVPGVEPLGRVPQIQPHLASAACSVIPIRVGGGTRIKLLESWAMGRSVVTTSVGCEGLAVTDGENALVRDEPHAFADAVVKVLDDAGKRHALGQAGRRTVEERYTWDRVGETLRSVYARLVRSKSEPARR